MSDNEWHSGPPPSLGWWPASIFRDSKAIRWWDGKCWSLPCYQGESLKTIASDAEQKCPKLIGIEWKNRPASWPARSKT